MWSGVRGDYVGFGFVKLFGFEVETKLAVPEEVDGLDDSRPVVN